MLWHYLSERLKDNKKQEIHYWPKKHILQMNLNEETK